MAKMDKRLMKKYQNTRILNDPSADALEQSSSTKQILQNVKDQIKQSKSRDWVIGTPFMIEGSA